MYTDAQKRSHIFDLQTFLRRIQQAEGSAAPLVPDGIWDAKTAAAVRDYQQQNGIPVTGTADFCTWTAIYAAYALLLAGDALPMRTAFFPPESDAVLKAGTKGSSVYVLQLMLSEIAPHYNRIAAVPLTGEYDSDTQAAVRRAQQIFQLPETCITDRATWQALTGLHNALFRRTPLGWQINGEWKIDNGDTHRSGRPASNRP